MTDLHDRLDDLVTDVPPYVVPDARRAWAAGARRRLTRRIGAGAAVVVLVALTAGLLGVLPRSSHMPPADGESRGVDGYPARIEKPWLIRDLPDRPGPLAAVVEVGVGEWLAVSSDSDVWRVPHDDPADSFPPALSSDGRMIGYLTGHTTYVLRDLVTGEETSFPEVTDNAMTRSDEGTWWLSGQAPGFWSPDGSRLLLPAYRWEGWDEAGSQDRLVLARDGSVAEVPHRGHAVGWLDDDSLAWLGGRGRSVELVVTDLRGTVERRLPLDVRARHLNQWSAALSQDRSRVAIVLSNSTGSLVTVSTSDGAVLSRENVGASGYCSPAWAGEDPAFVQSVDETSLDTTSGRRVVVVDPALQASCVLVAVDALAGERHEAVGDLFGTTWLSWHWQEVLLGVLGSVGAVAVFAWFLRRRGRRLRRA